MNNKQSRKQLDISLHRFDPILDNPPPEKGWIRTIRNALGMSARQLALRLGVAQQRVAQIEKQEPAGSLTMKSMRRIAESLDCTFVYGFVPETSLEKTIFRQAQRVAFRQLTRSFQTMDSDNQALSKQEKNDMLLTKINDLVREQPANLWDKTEY